LRAQLSIAKARQEVIEKKLAIQQASFPMVALRQRILNVPNTLQRRMLNRTDPRQVHRILREKMLRLLKDLKDLPQKVVDPDWLERVEEADD
jgi:hypothetical protein